MSSYEVNCGGKLIAMFDELNNDEQKPQEQKRTDYTSVIIFAITLPVLIFFSHIGKEDMGLNIGICLFVNLLAIKIRWKLRTHIWFWAVIVLVLALHVPVILMVRWPHEWVSKMTLLPIGLADLLITLGAVGLVEKFIAKAPPPDEEA